MEQPRRRPLTIRIDEDILAGLDESVRHDREDGRDTSREALIRRILRGWLRYLKPPAA